MKIEITYRDVIEADSVEEAFEVLLSFLRDCVVNEDLTPFSFIDEDGNEH
jgi:hypothetical protein